MTKQDIERVILLIETVRENIKEDLTDQLGNLEIALDEVGIKEIPKISKIFSLISEYELKISASLNDLQKLLSRSIDKIGV